MFNLKQMITVWGMAMKNREEEYAKYTYDAMIENFEFPKKEVDSMIEEYEDSWDKELSEAHIQIVEEDKEFFYESK